MSIKRLVFVLCMSLFISSLSFGNRTSQEKLQPGVDFEYLGAFRLPEEKSNGTKWNGGGHGMCFYPNGDLGGPVDGYPGSLFSISHVYQNYISEFTIPVPSISAIKDYEELPVAVTLQPFIDVAAGRQTGGLTGSTIVDIQYFPKQGNQECDKLLWTMYEYYMPHYDDCFHGWCNLNFSNLNSVGVWRIGSYPATRTSKYLFEIPWFWADQFVNGKMLAAGRYRTQNGGSMGPCLYACAPWEDGNPPEDASSIEAIELIEYSDYNRPVKGYSVGDDWFDGAWIVRGKKSALVLTGTKGYRTRAAGEYIYGVPDPDDVGGKGYHAGPYFGAILFYDPQIISESAKGNIDPSDIQPYAIFNVHNYLYDNRKCDRETLGGCGYDRKHQLFYVIERDVEGFWRPRKPIVHVFHIIDSGLEPDTLPPTVPLNLTLNTATSNVVNFSWDASSDNRDAVTYCVFRNDRPVAFTEWTNFSDDKVNPVGLYRYQVRAIDSSMNQSEFSAVLHVTTPAGTDTRVPLIWNVTSVVDSGTNIVVSWETDELSDSHIFYGRIYHSPTNAVEDSTMSRTHQLVIKKGLEPNREYRYHVASTDASGNTNKYTFKSFKIDSAGNVRNNKPVLDGIGAQRAYVGERIEIDLLANDRDTADSLLFGMTDIPSNAFFNAVTGKFSWQTQPGDEGIHLVTFSVTDGKDSDTEEVSLFVYSNTLSRCLLTIRCAGQTKGVVSNANTGSVCSGVLQELLNEGTTVSLWAMQNADNKFVCWNGDASVTNLLYQFQITNHTVVSAKFVWIDSDADGLPNYWEQRYGGNSTSMNPDDDLDGDGFSNRNEWLTDTVPTNSASLLFIDRTDWQNGYFSMQWTSATNRIYRVYFSPYLSLSDEGFRLIADNIKGAPPLNKYRDTRYRNMTGGFYRIECKLPE